MLKTPSVMRSFRCDAGSSRRIRRAASTSLCGKTLIAARLSRQPSMMLAWFSSSLMMTSSFVGAGRCGVGGEAALEHDGRLGLLELGEPALELDVDAHRAGDRPHRSRAHTVALQRMHRPFAQPRMRRETQVVVRGEVDDRPAVEGRVGALLVLEHPRVAVDALYLQCVDFRRQVPQRIVRVVLRGRSIKDEGRGRRKSDRPAARQARQQGPGNGAQAPRNWRVKPAMSA
jgi:hypothetical protein